MPSTLSLASPLRQLRCERLVEKNRRLVYYLVNRILNMNSANPDYEDAAQAGMIGLMKAARLFEPTMGFQFSTYAANAIINAITRWRQVNTRHGFTFVGDGKHGHYSVIKRPMSVDFIRDGNGMDLGDRLAIKTEQPEPDAGEVFAMAMGLLRPRERRVIQGRYVEGKTLREMAVELKITRERVRQIQINALERIRKKIGSV